MRTQCKRIYSALPTQCDRICNGRCDTACVSDASLEPRVQSLEVRQGSGLHTHIPLTCKRTTDPVTSSVHREVWHHLTAALASISLNDFGRDWPLPDRRRVRQLLAEFDADLCRWAAREARNIVVSQDRAPNITGLFEKKLRERAEARDAIRDSLAQAAAVGGEG